MDSAHKTLIDIASVSQRVVNALTRYAGCKTAEGFRLDRIVVGSQSILEILNKKLLQQDDRVDVRLVDWLQSTEPRTCLDTLNQMDEILNKKIEYSAKNFFKASQPGRAKDKSGEAIRLFQMRQGYFHFLLTTDVWNCERNVYQRLQTLVEHDTQRTEETPPSKSEYSSRAPREISMNQGVCAEKLKTILESLDAWDCKEIHRRTSRLRQPGTSTWLPKTNEFKTWRNTKDSFLWLRGKVGGGKTVLAASVIDYLRDTLQDGESLLFFYCDFRNERSTKAAEMMRSLLSQLLQQFHQHTIKSQGVIDDLEKEGHLMIDDIALLARYISRAAQAFNQQPLCVIDALDECNDLEDLLDALKQLENGGIRLFVTSRPLQVIRDGLTRLPSISMDVMNFEVAADISLHVERELDSHRRLRILETSLKDEIRMVLCRKADGMFRWVHCQLNTLKQCMTAVQIRKTLDDIPRDLDATYSRILLEIPENEWVIVRQALYWLVAAFEPLQLRQILEGLSIDVERRVLDRDSAPVHESALLDALGSLVTYDELTDVVTLSHASVKDYLTAESTYSNFPSYHIDTWDAHRQLALLCMSYIPAYLKQHQQSDGHTVAPRNPYRSRTHTDGFDSTYHTIQRPKSTVSPPPKPCSLLPYVQSSGFVHLAFIDPADRKVLRAIEAFDSDVRLYPIEWELLRDRSSYFKDDWPVLKHDLVLYILVAFAPAELLRLYIGHTPLKQRDDTNPLMYAALHRKLEHATILLERGACVEHKGWDLDGHCQILPLEVAVRSFDHRMVNFFLTEGSPVPCGLFEGIMQRYNRVAGCVVLKLLQTDEFVEWAAAVMDKKLLSCVLDPTFVSGMRWLSEEEIEAIERRLIQVGCDLSVRFDETALRSAVRAGRISIVQRMVFNGSIPLPSDIVLDATSWGMIRFLLDLGNDIHVVSPEEDTLLHRAIRASKDDCLETVQALVGAGCNFSACNLAGETPLHTAVKHGDYSIVKYLLSLDVPLPPDILLTASRFSMISFLLDQGADVRAIAMNGDTVLHAALRHHHCYDEDQCLEVAKLLIDAGCNPCLLNVLGETPLHAAAMKNHLPAVQYLLSLDIPLPADILLSVAGESSSTATELIKTLLDKGADVHAMSPNGDNLLCIVVNSYATEEERLRKIKILISAGCDPRICNKAGESLIDCVTARYSKYECRTVLEYLVSIGLPLPSDLKFCNKRRPLMMDYSQVTRDLIDNGGDMCAIAENGDTLLHLAVRAMKEKDALGLAKLAVVRSGCSPEALNRQEETPFHIAARQGYISVINYFLSLGVSLPSDILFAASTAHSNRAKLIGFLIQHGADATSTDAGATPLHLLFSPFLKDEYDALQSTRILIEAGCDPNSQDLDRKTPMHLAAQGGYVSVIEYLLSRGISPPRDILLDSITSSLRFFLRNGVDIQSFIPILPLHYILRSFYCYDEADHLEHIRILIDAGCDPSVEIWLRETPIHIAAGNGHISVVKYLLSEDAPLPSDVLLAVLENGSSWPFLDSSEVLLRFLIREGADANASTFDGDTPLHLVLRAGRSNVLADSSHQLTVRKCIEVLLNGGANPFAQNVDGKTPFDLAEGCTQFIMKEFLRLVQNSVVHWMHTVPVESRDHSWGATQKGKRLVKRSTRWNSKSKLLPGRRLSL